MKLNITDLTVVKIVSFLCPAIGLVLFFLWRKDEKEKAVAARKFMIIGLFAFLVCLITAPLITLGIVSLIFKGMQNVY